MPSSVSNSSSDRAQNLKMVDRNPILIKFEVKDNDEKTRKQSRYAQGPSKINHATANSNITKKSVKFNIDDADQAAIPKKLSLVKIINQPLNLETTRNRTNKIERHLFKPPNVRFDSHQIKSGSTIRQARRCTSASNKLDYNSEPMDPQDWIFPSCKSINRDMTLIDLDIKISDKKQYNTKNQFPPSLQPRSRPDSSLGHGQVDDNFRRPRSANTNGPVLRQTFPTKEDIHKRIHTNQWTFESRLPSNEESLSKPDREPDAIRKSQQAFRQTYRTPQVFQRNEKIIGIIPSASLFNLDSTKSSKSSNWGSPSHMPLRP